MRIALIAPPWFPVPPTGYGGIELVVSYLADGLTERGHEVTLFAAGGSRTAARLVSTSCTAPSAMIGNVAVEATHLVQAYSRWREFDIIHDHTLTGLVASGAVDVPVVHTLHGPIYPDVIGLYTTLSDRVQLVAISEHQRSTLPPNLPVTVIHNGIRTANFPFSPRPGDYLLFCGRVSPEKGIVQAIEIARRADMPLVMVLKINERTEEDYWEAEVKPRIAGMRVELYEQPPTATKLRLYRDAYATLFPIQWPEPFGLVMVESMATGTPVIAFTRGSAPEVVQDGVTGFLCTSVAGAVEVLPRVARLDRRQCRERVEMHFSEGLNVVRHEELYRRIVSSRSKPEMLTPMVEPISHLGPPNPASHLLVNGPRE